MRRTLLLFALATLGLGAAPALSEEGTQPEAGTQPAIYLKATCEVRNPYGGTYQVSGLQPNTLYTMYFVGTGAHTFTTDGLGNRADAGGNTGAVPFEVTVRIWAGSGAPPGPDQPPVLEAHFTVDRPCQDFFPDLPSSKEQCKDGGWRNYPGFKNQGDCVTFIGKPA